MFSEDIYLMFPAYQITSCAHENQLQDLNTRLFLPVLAVLQIFFLQGLCRNLVEARLAKKISNANWGWLASGVWVCARREVVPFLEITQRACAQLPSAVKGHFSWNLNAHLLKSLKTKDMN